MATPFSSWRRFPTPSSLMAMEVAPSPYLRWSGLLITISSVTVFTFVLRSAGQFQSFELTTLDTYFQLRPLEKPDKRILIVALEEGDIRKLKKWPLSDQVLATLLTKITLQHPTIVGLDLYRDLPVEPGYAKLNQVLKSTPNIVGVQKVIKNNDGGSTINPSPLLDKLNRTGANDILPDQDGVVRRGILFPNAEGKESVSSLAVVVALAYLQTKAITPVNVGPINEQYMKIAKTNFVPFAPNDGGYVGVSACGSCILLNYRGPANSFPTVSVTDVLENRIPPNLMRDRIVLIGPEAESLKDFFYTPYSKISASSPKSTGAAAEETSGIEVQANIASQIISSVLDNRPLIQVLNEPLQSLEIFLCIFLTPILIWVSRSHLKNKKLPVRFIVIATSGASIVALVLLGSSYLAFLGGWWIPVIAPLLGLGASTLISLAYVYVSGWQSSEHQLSEVLEDSQDKDIEIQNYSQSLEQSSQALQESSYMLNLALDATCTGILNWDRLTDKVNIYKNCSKLIGSETEDFVGSFEQFLELVVWSDRKILNQLLVRSVEEKLNDDLEDIEFRVYWPTGSIHWLQARIQMYYERENAKVTSLLGTITNIDKRKAIEDSTNNLGTRWHLLIQNSFEMITILSSTWEFLSLSPSVRRILGYLPKDLIGQKFIGFVHSEDLSRVIHVLEESVRNPTNIFQVEYRHCHKNDSWLLIKSTISNGLGDKSIRGFIFNSLPIT